MKLSELFTNMNELNLTTPLCNTGDILTSFWKAATCGRQQLFNSAQQHFTTVGYNKWWQKIPRLNLWELGPENIIAQIKMCVV